MTYPSKIYFKPQATKQALRRYGFKILREKWRGGVPSVSMTLTQGDVVYEVIKYETYDWYGLGLCECLEILQVKSSSALSLQVSD